MGKQLQPKLRFPGFENNLSTSFLKDIAKFSKGKNISKADINENGKYECIRYGELYTKYNEVINVIHSRTNLEKSSLVFSEENDVIIPASGESAVDIATASCVKRSGIALGGDLNIIKTKENGIFLSYYFNSRKKYDIAKKAQGISVIHIYSEHLKSLSLNLPSIPEQQKIAGYLSTIDQKISLLKEKKVESIRYKKSMMQKLFSQEIRFKDDDRTDFGEWEIVRLGDISERVRTKNKENSQNILTISGQKGLINQFDYFLNQYAAKDVTGYYFIQKDDFAYNKSYSKGYPYGAIKRLVKYESGVLSTLYICFRFKINHSFSFFEHFFESGTFNHNLYKICVEGARNHGLLNVGIDDFFNEKISIPSLPEQQKIADFLSAIDNSINKVEEQIHQTKLFKKAMLQQMFV